MPILDGYDASKKIRTIEDEAGPSRTSQRPSHINNKGRLPVFAVSASLPESQRSKLVECGMNGWILKPIDFRRLRELMKGLTDRTQRSGAIYKPGYNWESGGWLSE
jgi:CheY-like chemotaxis protein